MHVVCALVGIHCLQIHDVTNHVILIRNSVAAVHVARHAGDIQRLAAVVALDERKHLRRRPALVHQPSDAQRSMQAQGDFRLHVGELQLHQLVRGQRPAELVAVQRVLPRRVPAEFRRAHGAPGDAVARLVQTAERAFQAFHVGQQVFLGNEDLIHDDLAGDRRAQ